MQGLLVLINEGNLSCSQVDLSLAEVDNTDCLSEQDGEDLCLQTQDISEGKMKRESTDHRSTNSCLFQIRFSAKIRGLAVFYEEQGPTRDLEKPNSQTTIYLLFIACYRKQRLH